MISLNDHPPPTLRVAEVASGYRARDLWLPGDSFREAVSRGVVGPRHISMGYFRQEDVALYRPQPGTQCFVPYFVLEPEYGELVDNYYAMIAVLNMMRSEDIETTHFYVMFSGRKSFHLLIPAGSMGYPTGNVQDFVVLYSRMWPRLTEVDLDLNLGDPRHLIRLPGSVHPEGSVCTTMTAKTFSESTLEMACSSMLAVTSHASPTYHVPRCSVLSGLVQQRTAWYAMDKGEIDESVSKEAASLLPLIAEGVSEGEPWHNHHAGRDKAAYMMALYQLSIYSAAPGHAFELMKAWNMKNDPPLSLMQLMKCFKSARRVQGRRSSYRRE